jgi:hypothetical protein
VGSNETALLIGGSLHAGMRSGVVAGEILRVLLGCAAGVKPVADPVERITVNVGSAPSVTSCWWRPVRRDVR